MLILHPYKKPFPYNKKKTIPMLPTLSYLSPTKKKIDLSSDLLKNFLLTMSHWLIPTLETTYLSYFLMYVSSGLVENPIQLCPTGKKFPLVSILYIYRILCKQWDLNPHSFTLLFPKNSLSTNFNMLTLLYTKNPLP